MKIKNQTKNYVYYYSVKEFKHKLMLFFLACDNKQKKKHEDTAVNVEPQTEPFFKISLA